MDDTLDNLPRAPDPSEMHLLRCLVAESLEVLAATFALLTVEDPPRVDLAANEVQQAHQRISAAIEKELL